MKVALIAPPFVEVPPKGYGGTERVLEHLTNSLIKMGISITLYASGDSSIKSPLKPICKLALFNDPTYNHSKKERHAKTKKINKKTVKFILEDKPDIVNTHDYDNFDLINRLSKLNIPILVTVRHAMTNLIEEVYSTFKGNRNIFFQGLTKKQIQDLDKSLPTICNGYDIKKFIIPNFTKRDYFFSIGDTKPIKGHRFAIELAKESRLSLVIAGAPYYPSSKSYFEKEIRPFIDFDFSDNKERFLEGILSGKINFGKGKIFYFGTASNDDKKVLFGHAKFMQFLGNLEVKGNIDACPGTVIESSLYGIPVMGVSGSVTEELVYNGVTGYNVPNITEAGKTIQKISKLEKEVVAKFSQKKFSSIKMAKEYKSLYEKILTEYNGIKKV